VPSFSFLFGTQGPRHVMNDTGDMGGGRRK
jgi:hypothetical protein